MQRVSLFLFLLISVDTVCGIFSFYLTSVKMRTQKERKILMNTRVEHDSMGEIEVPTDRYWGAQTQRSYQNFKISAERLSM